MHRRKLGSRGLEVSALGLGCMGMSFAYGAAEEHESMRVLHRTLELGVSFWDTAEMYGPFLNEELLGRALKAVGREKVTIATKFAYRFSPEGVPVELDGSPAHIRKSVEGSLKRLGTDYIDLYYQHRLDPKTPVEETMGALAELVEEGKVLYVGLSEVGPGTIRRAHAVHPVAAVQSEYSLWERGIEEKVLPALRELGIGFVAYSPTGRGFLTGRFKSLEDLDASDWRRRVPRFSEENLKHNLELVSTLKEIASAHGATPAQVALAWLLRQGGDIVPLFGTKHVSFLEEDARAADLILPEAAWSLLDRELRAFKVMGDRYPEDAMKTIDNTEEVPASSHR